MGHTFVTPHIDPKGADIAETMLLPGDPRRATYIAKTFLDDVQEFNGVRNIYGYTGTFEGNPISVMGTGMGIPSIGIYASELVKFFDVKKLIRVGSCGSLQANIDLYEVIVGISASTDSNWLQQYNLPGTFAPTASWKLVKAVVDNAEQQGKQIHVGNILSADAFYNDDETVNERWSKMGVLGVEMESAALYAIAARHGVEALGVFTVSDNVITGSSTTPQERETAFTSMMELALPLAGLKA